MSRRHRAVSWAVWRRFKRGILERDGWRCVWCREQGKPGVGRLEVHHVIPLHVDETLYLEPSNCVTLCRSCHVRHHRRPETPERLAWIAFRDDLRASKSAGPE